MTSHSSNDHHARRHGPAVLEMLLGWQSTGETSALETLIQAIRPTIEKVAAATLRRHAIRDPAAVDDAVALVLDHLRRLPNKGTGDAECDVCRVRQAAPDAELPHVGEPADRGTAYIVWLARQRACDVARSCRRHWRHARQCAAFGNLDSCFPCGGLTDHPLTCSDDAVTADLHERLLEAVAGLEHRERLVIELLLEGKSQAVIAHVLDVCEGTVSRIRASAIKSLRRMLAE